MYETQGGTLAFFVLVSKLVSVLRKKIDNLLVDFFSSLWGHFGDSGRSFECLLESFEVNGGPWGPKGAQGSPKSDFGHIWGSFWEPSGSSFGIILA